VEDTNTQGTGISVEELISEAEASQRGNTPSMVDGADKDAPTVVSRVKGTDGLIPIYDRKTGEQSTVLEYMLRELLKAKSPVDGSLRFTTRKPPFSLKQGTHKCLLHPDNPERAHYDELGFPVCLKSNLTSPFMVKKHMRSRHKIEWATIEEERKDEEKRAEQEFQRSIINRATPPPKVKAPLYVSDKDKGKPKKKAAINRGA